MRKSRSEAYQYVIVEVVMPDVLWVLVDNNNGYTGLLNPWGDNKEAIMDLEDKLFAMFWELAAKILTERQYQVLRMYSQGMTQHEIAAKLNVNQSSIAKCLKGNADYNNPQGTKVYGGLTKKLRKFIDQDKKIQDTLKQIRELKMEII